MNFHKDNRAVAPVIGFILLLGMGFIGLSVYQAEYVPQQNSETEFEHSQLVVNDLTELSEAIADTAGADLPQRATVKLGTRYRTRIITLNPPPAAGTLQTTDLQPVEISGEEAYQTRLITYRANYNRQTELNYTVENGLVGDRANDFVLESSTTITDDTVVLTQVEDEISENGVRRSQLEFAPQPTEQFTAEDPVEVTFPTYLSRGTWESELSGTDHEVVRFESGEINRVTIEVAEDTELIYPTEEDEEGEEGEGEFERELEWDSIDITDSKHQYNWEGEFKDGDVLTIDLKEIAPPPGQGGPPGGGPPGQGGPPGGGPPGQGGGGSAGFDYEEDLMFSSDEISYKSSNRQLTVTVDGDSTEGFFWVDVTQLDGNAGSYTVTISDEYGNSDTETVTFD